MKLKEDQPQVWEKEHFIEFLKQLPFLKHIADKFSKILIKIFHFTIENISKKEIIFKFLHKYEI